MSEKKSSSRTKDAEKKSKSKEKAHGKSSSKSKERASKSSLASKDAASADTLNTSPTGEVGADNAGTTSPDFEAGLLFGRYASAGGGVDARDFQRLWRDYRDRASKGTGPAPLVEPESANLSPDLVALLDYVSARRGLDERLSLAELKAEFVHAMEGERRLGSGGAPAAVVSPTAPASAIQSGSGGAGAPGAGAVGGKSLGNDGEQRRPGSYDYSNVSVGPPMTHYSETTGVPLPRAAVAGELGLGHTVVPLHEAYNRRLGRLQALMSSRLMPAREQLLQQRRRLLSRAEEIKSAKASIERETMADTNAVLERLRSADALKQATISQYIGGVTAELDAVDKIVDQVAGITALGGHAAAPELPLPPGTRYAHEFEATGRMIDLIQNYGELCSAVERTANRPLDPTMDVSPDDFPRETAERLEVLRRADRYEKALALKDQMVWNLMQDSKNLEGKVEAESALSAEYASEIAEWVALTQRMSGDIVQLREKAAATERLEQENKKLMARVAALERACG